MKRSEKPRKVGVVPWLIGLLLVGGGLVGLFSLGRASWLQQVPGLHVGAAEWELYRSLFDRHPTSAGLATLPFLRFGTSQEVPECLETQHGGAWRTRWFEGEGHGDSVEVRNLLNRPGYAVRFKKDAPYNEQRRIMLTPAVAETLRSKQLETIAQDLGLFTPALSLVRVLSCGSDRGVYLEQEWVDTEMLERRGIRGATLLKMGMDPTRPEVQFPAIDADSTEQVKLRGLIERSLSEVANGNTDMLAGIMDEKAAASWALMAWIDGRDPRTEWVPLVYHWSTERFTPLYQVPSTVVMGTSHEALGFNLITALFKRPSFRARFARMQAELATAWPEIQRRHAATYALWASLLGTSATSSITATHIANGNATAYFDRELLFGPGHATFVHGMELPVISAGATGDTMAVVELAKRYRLTIHGDSIIFPRGKYVFDSDVEFPAGRSVVLLQGARLFIGGGRSITVKGDLFIRGTMRNPVFIRPLSEDAPFGTVAVVGGTSQRCAISGLYVSGGTGAKLAGIEYGGMVTVRGAALTRIESSVFQENTAEASLVVDGGELELRDVRWQAGSKRFARLDHVRGVVHNPVMVGGGTNGTTGLSIGTGTLAVLGGTFTGMQGAAIVVDGAAQVLVRGVRLSQNAVALRCEGRAEVHADGNTVDGNEVAFAVRSDVPGDHLVLYANHLSGNKVERSGENGFRSETTLGEATAAMFGTTVNDSIHIEERPSGGRGSRRGRPR